MARSEHVLSIFLASPGDLSIERALVKDVIDDWNRAWTRDLGVRLELLRWEDDAFPDIGDDAQEVINRQIPPDWDIFIGIMWSRFGTPTDRAGSGTEEEFQRALSRYRSNPESVRLLFYFKDAPVAPSKIDVAQLEQVRKFKQYTQAAGLLTWDFADADQFEKLIGLHTTKHVQEWRRSRLVTHAQDVQPLAPLPQVASATKPDGEVLTGPDDDDGYLDLLETFANRSNEMAQIALRIKDAEDTLTAHAEKGRLELDEIRANPTNNAAERTRESIRRVSTEMLSFTACLEEEVPLFRAAVDGCITTLTRLATLSAEIYPQQLHEAKKVAFNLLQTLIAARQATEGFRDSTSSLPRLTKDLNLAKRKQAAALESLISEFKNGERLLTEGLSVIDSLTSRS